MQALLNGLRFLGDQRVEVGKLFWQHIQLTSIALAIALLIALPLGWLLSRVRWLQTPILSVLGIIYTIPSLSLFVLLIPWLGLGSKPALVALVAYAQIVLVRNILLGINSIDPAIIEAAKGMGMSNWQRLIRIELPLALPLILAGIRIATLSIIAIASIAAYIGAGGLGQLLFQGVATGSRPRIIAGSIALIGLALLANLLFHAIEWAAARWLGIREQASLGTN
jgi:osmoprotectant transport system permease protein